MQAIAQLLPALGFAQQRIEIVGGLRKARTQCVAAQGIQRFIGEVDRRFHVHAQPQQRVRQCVDATREHAVQRTPRRAGGARIAGHD